MNPGGAVLHYRLPDLKVLPALHASCISLPRRAARLNLDHRAAVLECYHVT